MSSQFTFSTPADIHDFPVSSSQDLALCAQWNTNITGFTQQAIVGDPWNELYASDQTSYFDSTVTPIPQGSTAAIITWNAFPNRLGQYLGSGASPVNPYNYSNNQLLEVADQYAPSQQTLPVFQQIPVVLCPQADWKGQLHQYGPYGPRGWQDEYCEWSVVRDPTTNKITRIDFTCENPEYWNTLWMIDPQKVADLYTETLNWGVPSGHQIQVYVEDLYLLDPTSKKPVIDPSTGRPAYNPLNRWNSGPTSIRPKGGCANPNAFSGGAMHLTSTPNTLQTEMQLAGGATILRTCGNSQPQQLICCAQYGQAYRNSDPHIGQSVNQVVGGQLTGTPSNVALANPTGLYIQVPDLSTFALPADPRLPAGATVQDCWQIVRGAETLIDPVTGLPYGLPLQGGNFVLHAVFQLPIAWVNAGVQFTIGDIKDGNGNPIQWGGQVTKQMDIGLWARPLAVANAPAAQSCVDTSQPSFAQPLQLFHQNVWNAYYTTQVNNPMGTPISLASNSTLIAAIVRQGESNITMCLTCATVKLGPNGELPQVNFGADIMVQSLSYASNIFYAVPGNSYPSECGILTINVSVSVSAVTGLKGLSLTNYGDQPQVAMPALLNVVGA